MDAEVGLVQTIVGRGPVMRSISVGNSAEEDMDRCTGVGVLGTLAAAELRNTPGPSAEKEREDGIGDENAIERFLLMGEVRVELEALLSLSALLGAERGDVTGDPS